MTSCFNSFRRAGAAFAVFASIGVLTLAGCDAMEGSNDGEARLRLLLTDAPFPFDLVAEANVTIDSVRVIQNDSTAYTLDDSLRTVNLLDWRSGKTTLLGDLELEAGEYEQIRLYVSDPHVVLNDQAATVHDLKVPSGVIKINLGGLELEEDETKTVTLDFDVEKSFVVQGNPNSHAGIKGFLFKPEVKLAKIQDGEEDSDD